MASCELQEIMSNLDSTVCLSHSLNINQCNVILKKLHECCKTERKRQAMSKSHWNTLMKVAVHGNTLLKKGSLSDDELDFLTNLFRCLRNSCAGCCRDDQMLISINELLSASMDLLFPLIKQRQNTNEKGTIALQCCLQLFGNLVCQSNTSKHTVWKSFIEEGLFKTLLEDKEPKVQEYTMMILYNCVVPEHQLDILNTDEGHEILITLLNSLCNNIIDWGILLTESIISSEDFMEKVYTILPTQNRLLVLDVIMEQLDCSDSSEQCVPESLLKYIKQLFVDYVLDIMNICESYSGDLKSIEITKLLSILCVASVARQCRCVLKSYGDLLEVAIDILKSVHLLGKKSCNAFSTLSSMKDVTNLSKEDIEFHPSFGFKKNLIRLIANMCSKCSQNQDLVRNMDGIPLLLDCCNIDVRNPYIMQWCILAIHNLLENNPNNQAALANISVTGEMANSSLLHELGLTVQIENGSPVLKVASATAK